MASRSLVVLLLAVILLSASSSSLWSQSKPSIDLSGASSYVNAITSLAELAPDPTKVAVVEQLLLTRDVGTILLEEGKLYLCKPINGRVYVAVFVGKGLFQYTPSTWMEVDQLERYTKERSLNQGFTTMLFVAADSTFSMLEQDWGFESATVPPEVEKQIENSLSFFLDAKSGYAEPEFLLPILNNDYSPFFYAHFVNEHKSSFFEINPYDHTGEEVRFMLEGDRFERMRLWKPVNQFHTKEEYAAGKTKVNDAKEVLKVSHYAIETSLPKGKEFAAVTDLSFSVIGNNNRWLYCYLYPELIVDSAFWEDGTPAVAFGPINGMVWMRLRDGLDHNGDTGRIRMYYHGDVIQRLNDWFDLKSSIGWYPHHGYKQKATFDLTFHIPKEFRFISIGKKVSEEERNGFITTRWVTDSAVRNVSFNLGFFDEHIVQADSLPPITVWISRYGHSGVGLQELAASGRTSGSDMEKQVAQDVEGSIRLYQKLFGPYRPEQIFVTEIPEGHGEAFPGLIHISWTTFQRNDASGWDYRFRAHEVAHQWWGASGVDFLTYHDQWLSEGFADYSSLMYLQGVSPDRDAFTRTLRQWRDHIVNNINAGPVSNGNRLGNAYNIIVYEKGAWVLHMLRNMMLDLKTMKEDRFIAMMHDFFQTYSGKEASTDDFQAIVQKHMEGADMSWFFNQWIYSTAIPTYKFEYALRKGEDGKYIATVKVEQKNVPPDFQMYVPLKIDYGKEGVARLRVLIKGSGGEFELPPLPFKPKDIVFNDLESVLCEID